MIIYWFNRDIACAREISDLPMFYRIFVELSVQVWFCSASWIGNAEWEERFSSRWWHINAAWITVLTYNAIRKFLSFNFMLREWILNHAVPFELTMPSNGCENVIWTSMWSLAHITSSETIFGIPFGLSVGHNSFAADTKLNCKSRERRNELLVKQD